MDLESYREEAEQFIGEMDREYYLHYSGQKDDFEIEQVYADHAGLFSADKVAEIRDLLGAATGDDERQLLNLLRFCADGYMGQVTKEEATELAQREATLTIEVGGEEIPYRQSAVVQQNEADYDRRGEIEKARLEAQEGLNPLYIQSLEKAQAISKELGWQNYLDMYRELKGIDLDALERDTHGLTEATEDQFEAILGPELESELGFGFDRFRRCDIPYFFRAPSHDSAFPSSKLVSSFKATMEGLGIDLDAQKNVHLDLEKRSNKSPRAFCAPVKVPDEIYLVVPIVGGRDDYFALFHEGGHTEHYAHTDPSYPFEFRYLGDNSVTEGFAFLFHHLVESPAWLSRMLGVEDVGAFSSFARAVKLVYLRRYAAKLRYELQLHSNEHSLDQMSSLYSELLSGATHTDWPGVTYLSDVDPGFYAANYLRAWAFEQNLRDELEGRYGEEWFLNREAGDFLKEIWSYGQKYDADELLEQVAGRKLDFSLMSSVALGV